MKWYSEKELKKLMGHTITLPLLEQMEYKEKLHCGDCPFWKEERGGSGNCELKAITYRYSKTYMDDECSEGFAR